MEPAGPYSTFGPYAASRPQTCDPYGIDNRIVEPEPCPYDEIEYRRPMPDTPEDLKAAEQLTNLLFSLSKDSNTISSCKISSKGVKPAADASPTVSSTEALKRGPRSAKNRRMKLLRNKERRYKKTGSASSVKMEVEGIINGIPCIGLIDNGSDISALHIKFCDDNKEFKDPQPSRFQLTTIDGSPYGTGLAYHDVEMTLGSDFHDFWDYEKSTLPDGYSFLLGIDWLSHYRVDLDHTPNAKNNIKLFEPSVTGGKPELRILSSVNLVSAGPKNTSSSFTPRVHVCGVESVSGQNDDIEILSDRKFKKMKKKIFKDQSKHGQIGGSLGVKGAVCMMVALTALACAGASVMIGSESKSPPSTAII